MFLKSLTDALMIAFFVLVMMLIIEYITILRKGSWNILLKQKSWTQVFFAALMGLIPGCLGTYAVVSLYTHRIIGFAAMVTVMIATSGDEAFIMFSMIPSKAFIVMGTLFAVATLVGLVIYPFTKNIGVQEHKGKHFQVHKHEIECFCFDTRIIIQQLKSISFHRALLIAGGILFMLFLFTTEYSHGEFGGHEGHNHEHSEGMTHGDWLKITLYIVSVIGLFIVATVPEHFLKEHLWGHVIKKHFLKIFLWTLVAIFFINILTEYWHFEEWLKSAHLYILLVAVLVGFIPESGPHLVFITLFAGGAIPISILIANSIVQDGHGSLPLLAESRKSFFMMKAINMIVGLAVGLIGYFIGF